MLSNVKKRPHQGLRGGKIQALVIFLKNEKYQGEYHECCKALDSCCEWHLTNIYLGEREVVYGNSSREKTAGIRSNVIVVRILAIFHILPL